MEYILLLAAILFAVIVLFSMREDLKTVRYEIASNKVGKPMRFVVLSDLHGGKYGEGQKEIIDRIKEYSPDAVLLPGDIIDNRKRNEKTYSFTENIGKFRCFYSVGNHEYRISDYQEVINKLRNDGFCVLENELREECFNGESVTISGMNDIEYYINLKNEAKWNEDFEKLSEKVPGNRFSILLSHHPNHVESYERSPFDLILSGHAHGGQMILPFINGIYAPGQGLFPKYAGGRYDLGNGSVLIVSRGLSRDHTPRIFNRPEFVVIDVVPSSCK